ncbi:MAG: hypothetical protein Q8P67_24550 [archaeon]|nr:hypothetical protein [archaeon]
MECNPSSGSKCQCKCCSGDDGSPTCSAQDVGSQFVAKCKECSQTTCQAAFPNACFNTSTILFTCAESRACDCSCCVGDSCKPVFLGTTYAQGNCGSCKSRCQNAFPPQCAARNSTLHTSCSGLYDWEVAVITVFALALTAVLGFVVYCGWFRKRASGYQQF